MTETRQRPARRRGVLAVLSRILRGGPPAAPRPKVAPRHPVLDSSVVDCGLYVDGVRRPGRMDFADALAAAQRRPRAFVWLGLHEPSAEEFAWVAQVAGLHVLAVEEATSKLQRPRIEHHGEHSRLVLRTARYVEHGELNEWSEVVETGHIMIFIAPRYVISVRHGAAGPLTSVRADLERQRELMSAGPWAVAYAICDRIVDTYLDVADAVEDDVGALEEAVFGRRRSQHIAHIYQLKREVMEFRRAVHPLQRPMQALLDERSAVPTPLRRYLREVSERLSRCVDQINTYDELLNSMLQARLAQVAVDQNNDMRKIAAYAAVAAVQTVIAGIYGMNFRHMPELEWKFGYPAVLCVMLLAGFTVYRLARRAGWL